jgi:signal transduction histidine kinase/CheY-like chemotaxis protein
MNPASCPTGHGANPEAIMTPSTTMKSFSPETSLKARILLAISATVLLLFAACVWFMSQGIDRISLVQVRHEGLLLANTVEAAIATRAADADVVGIQSYIDELVGMRGKNDLEINVTFLAGNGAEVVASNVPDNIESADEDECLATLTVLRTGEPDLALDVEEGPEDGEEEAFAKDPSHPDFYFPAGSRLLSITTPLNCGSVGLGSINIKLSLHYLDREVARLSWIALLAVGLGCAVLAGLLTPVLAHSVFRPLTRLAREMYAFGVGEDIGEMVPASRKDEIGVLRNEFFNMVARVKSAEAMREELARVRAERKERELETRLRQAQKMEALGTLAGGIAHDFNNILTPILGYAELLSFQAHAGDDNGIYLEEILHAATRAKDLVRQILTFSRQSDEDRDALRIGPIVKETMKLLRASIPANVEVRQDIRDGDALVMGCPTHIHQVVLNLATNACQAMVDEGGCLDVRLNEIVLECEASVGEACRLDAGRYLKLTVADSGPGIHPHLVQRIFEPYFTTKEEGKGTGLGLAMVHGIVQDMGGVIVVGSELGKGTRFEAYFPVASAEAAAAAFEEEVPLQGGTERILVVDDEKPIADLLGQMLGSLGYDVCTFSAPCDALACATGAPVPFDLVVSDVAMPGMTGVEFVRQLVLAGAAAPVVFCSAYTGGINWKSARAFGIQAIVTKPVRVAELATTVRSVLDHDRQRARQPSAAAPGCVRRSV